MIRAMTGVIAGMIVVVTVVIVEAVVAMVVAVTVVTNAKSELIALRNDALLDEEMTAELHQGMVAVLRNHCVVEGHVVAKYKNPSLATIAAKEHHQLRVAAAELGQALLAIPGLPVPSVVAQRLRGPPARLVAIDPSLEFQVCLRETKPLGPQRERFRRPSEGCRRQRKMRQLRKRS
jgi:hypothetical protein